MKKTIHNKTMLIKIDVEETRLWHLREYIFPKNERFDMFPIECYKMTIELY